MHLFPIVWDESIENNYFTKYDYALITLKTSFNMSLPYINPICLPNKLMDIWENPHTNYSVEYTVTGFGLINSSHTPNYMHFAKVINYPPRKIFRVPINQICKPYLVDIYTHCLCSICRWKIFNAKYTSLITI